MMDEILYPKHYPSTGHVLQIKDSMRKVPSAYQSRDSDVDIQAIFQGWQQRMGHAVGNDILFGHNVNAPTTLPLAEREHLRQDPVLLEVEEERKQATNQLAKLEDSEENIVAQGDVMHQS
ncbi:hypothetical protein SERLADRAFT_437073 [Serpula lacrymans var. lacrymans S7.9]|uniref:Uncharacterized protein n=1 Tax=Serpula lacrymans var. lacrymans (strain S7.9) TaxID=578457 RepID=F8NV55_SERL9|nr:uncharacterized protein SERLADRAFT_437073 [Serpula lacrymans var. lacrymans S7.9]EGO25317.1 hypothetical protein SERLADRAFT_437073 [Serpula lacrymans var. lacrymans S7.9]